MSDQMQGALDYLGRMRNPNGRSIIGGGAGNGGVAQFPVQSASPAGGFAATTPATPGLGAGGFAVAPAAAAAAPELAAETPSGDLGAMAAAAAATPDPYNNAARAPQQDAVGQIQGNAFMRQQSMQGLV
tara:strand:+ start:154 stop:540 length:387 start_codon:yes stop_codon:yes gene_type:complete